MVTTIVVFVVSDVPIIWQVMNAFSALMGLVPMLMCENWVDVLRYDEQLDSPWARTLKIASSSVQRIGTLPVPQAPVV